ncbi:hypothetical protein KSP40_PGU000989 [Platanthera guangdongensis]|uniref:Alpha-ketoglutarate-dependent dioxygenase AlkB-like domain-containing protein n=1 Tax=Platanthera guangdongensis TaxID=2320717 RepID=A0ABR2MBS0_9ASPA
MGGRRSLDDVADDLASPSLGGSVDAAGGKPAAEEDEAVRLSKLGRKKDFKYMERVRGRLINVLEGLELHTGVFSAAEQRRIVNCIYDFRERGRKGQLRDWIELGMNVSGIRQEYHQLQRRWRGKGRVTIQFRCCYNYAMGKDENLSGIIHDEQVNPIPPLLKQMIKRMVIWRVLAPTCVPNNCIINIYDKDDCIPPHIDHHDFFRPFCTVSFLSECNIIFGMKLKIIGLGDFLGCPSIPLLLGYSHFERKRRRRR